MKLAVIAPVLNEVDFIGYSIISALPYVHSIHYGIDSKSNDGTFELVKTLADTKAKGKLFWYRHPEFDINPMDMKAYNQAFNRLIGCAIGTGADGVFFLHPDMIISAVDAVPAENYDALALYTHMTSYAGDLKTVITKGRADKWKNIHAARFGLRYYGGYGSTNEDFYHKEITGNSYKHFGTEFSKYPFRVADSGIRINHYCENKSYKRRLEKMKLCLKTLSPQSSDEIIAEAAINHPRVTLESSSKRFGEFEFSKSDQEIPSVFKEYKDAFDLFKKEAVNV
jgi:hypothetical protein